MSLGWRGGVFFYALRPYLAAVRKRMLEVGVSSFHWGTVLDFWFLRGALSLDLVLCWRFFSCGNADALDQSY
jgi:hypothetical protein